MLQQRYLLAQQEEFLELDILGLPVCHGLRADETMIEHLILDCTALFNSNSTLLVDFPHSLREVTNMLVAIRRDGSDWCDLGCGDHYLGVGGDL